jgi:hypothetical protein
VPIGLKGNSDGSGAIQIGGSDAISISTGLNTTFAGTITATGTVAGTTGTLYPIVSGTAVSATGTAVDFTGIPSWAKRITVMMSGLSTNGTSQVVIQLGDSGGFETSGYDGSISRSATTNDFSASFIVHSNIAAATIAQVYVAVSNINGNTWVETSTASSPSNTASIGTGSKTLSGVLDRVRITTVNGTDTFDAGTINILFE